MHRQDLLHTGKLCGSLLPNALFLYTLLTGLPRLHGQDGLRARVDGWVTDPSRGVIGGAAVTLRGPSGARRTTATDASGAFAFEGVAPGPYQLTVSASGFAEHTRQISATADGAVPVTVTLHPRTVSESLTVVERLGDVAIGGTKTEAKLIETPQAVSVITRQQLTEQSPLNVQDALRYVAGVRAETYGFDARGDWATMRGGSWGQYLNGLRMLFGFYNNTRPDPFALDRVEVLRGPSSVLYGQGGFGGVINLVSKRPLPVQRREIQMQFGSFGRKQIALDLTGPVDEEGKWLYRLVALGRDSGTQVDHVPDDRMLVAPSLTWRPRTGTTLTLLTNFQEDRMGSSVGFFPWQGTLLPAPKGRIPTNTFISEPGFDEYNTSQRAIGYLFEHRFNSTWTVRQNVNYSFSTASYQSLYSAFGPRPVLNPDGETINRVIYVNKPTAKSPLVDTHAQASFRTGPLAHTVLTGVDWQKASINGFTGYAASTPINVYKPVYGNYTPPSLSPIAESRQDQTGVYVQDQVKIAEKWVALLGARKDWAHAETVGSAASRLDSTAVTGRAGLVYLTNFGLAPYASYATSFQPLAGFDFYDKPFRPQRAKQAEVGAKYEARNGRGIASLALFDLTELNRKTPDPNEPRNSIQVGEARIRGVEVETGARIFWRLDLIGSYTLTDARVSRSNSADMGKRLATVPRHMSSLWLTRKFSIGGVEGFSGGGGVRATGSSFDGMDQLRTPAYTLYDAMLSYETQWWRFSVNVANLTDKTHVTTCLARGDCFYGTRRAVTGTVSYQF